MVNPTARGRVRFTHRLLPVLLVFLGVFLFLLLSLGSPKTAYATSADTVNFQARLQTGGGAIAPDGTYNVEFKLYNTEQPGTGTPLWTEDYLVSAGHGLTTINGYLSANLGSITPFPSTIDWSQQLYLTMNIGGTSSNVVPTNTSTTGWDGEMSPRLALTATPYAFQAQQAANATNAGELSTTNGSNTATLSIQAPNNEENFYIQDQGTSGNFYLLTTAQANSSYVELQSVPQSQQTGEIDITGSASVGSVLTNTLDTASGGTLTIGGTHSTSVAIGSATSAVSLQGGATRISVTNSSGVTVSGAALTANAGLSATGGTIALGTASGDTVTIGNTSSTNAITIEGENITDAITGKSSNPTDIVKGNSTGLFQVQSSTSSVFVVDTVDDTVGINTAPGSSYALNVNGYIESNSGLDVNGTPVCTTACTPSPGSGNYIQNSTSFPTNGENIAIQTVSASSPVAVFRGATNQSADLFDIQTLNGSNATNVVAFGSNGDITATSAETTGTAYTYNANSVTTGNGMVLNANGLTTGYGLDIATTSNVQAAGSLLNVSDTATLSTNGGTDTGNLVNVSRSLTANISGGSTATPTLDNQAAFYGTTASSSTWQPGSLTVSAGHSNYYVMVGIYDENTCVGPPTITFGGKTLSMLTKVKDGTDSVSCYFLFGSTFTTTGSNAISVTPNGSTYYQMTIDDWYNVNQSTPYGTVQGAGGTSPGAPSETYSWPSGHVIVDHNHSYVTSCNVTPSAGQTSISSLCVSTGGNYSSYKLSTGGSQTMSYTGGGSYWADAELDLIGATTTSSEAVSGAVASFSNSCSITVGACTDATNVLSLNQQYASATGAVANIQNSGSGFGLQIQSGSSANALTVTTANLTGIDTTTSSTAAVLTLGKVTGGDSIAAEGAIASSLGDYAEYFPQANPGQLRPGDVACLNTDGQVETCGSGSTANSLVGVVSSGPGFVGNNQIHDPTHPGNTALISMVGQVPVQVSDANGAIHVGDMLTFDPNTGLAVRATSAGMTIGEALADFSGGTGTIQLYIHIGYYDPMGLQSDGVSSGYVLQGDQATLTDLTVTGAANITMLNVTGNAIVANLTVTTSLTTAGIIVNGHIITEGATPMVTVGSSAGSEGTCTVTGNDTSGKIVLESQGTGQASGAECTLTFSAPFGSAPNPVITPLDGGSVSMGAFAQASTTTLTIDFMNTPVAGQTYSYSYFTPQ